MTDRELLREARDVCYRAAEDELVARIDARLAEPEGDAGRLIGIDKALAIVERDMGSDPQDIDEQCLTDLCDFVRAALRTTQTAEPQQGRVMEARRNEFIRAFVRGARHERYSMTGATQFPTERDIAEAEGAKEFDAMLAASQKEKP